MTRPLVTAQDFHEAFAEDCRPYCEAGKQAVEVMARIFADSSLTRPLLNLEAS